MGGPYQMPDEGLFIFAQSLVDWDVWHDGDRIARIHNMSGYKRRGAMHEVKLYLDRKGGATAAGYDYKIVNSFHEAMAAVKAAFGLQGPARRWGPSQHKPWISHGGGS